jgi:hypothetical protein
MFCTFPFRVGAGALFPGGRGGQHVLYNARARREGDEDCARRDGDTEEDGRLRQRGGRHHHAAAQGAHRQARGIQETNAHCRLCLIIARISGGGGSSRLPIYQQTHWASYVGGIRNKLCKDDFCIGVLVPLCFMELF